MTLDTTDTVGLTDTSTTEVTVAHAIPTAAVTVRSAQPVRGRQVRFGGSASHPADEPMVTYTWRFGDGGSATGRTPAHAYARAGRYAVSLTVSDSFGDSSVATTTVVVTRHGGVTGVDARASRNGATMLVSVNSAGTLTVNRRTLSIKGPGTAGVPIHVTRSQLPHPLAPPPAEHPGQPALRTARWRAADDHRRPLASALVGGDRLRGRRARAGALKRHRQDLAAAAVNQDMALRDLVILCGLALAGWGHLLLAERRLASTAWRRLDDLFPAAWRSTEPVAGWGLLAMGAFCVLAAMAAGA